jgi:hypothetical protein
MLKNSIKKILNIILSFKEKTKKICKFLRSMEFTKDYGRMLAQKKREWTL